MRRAIEEQRENMAENPGATAVAQGKSNVENLLDIDFGGDDSTVTSPINAPVGGGLEELLGMGGVASPMEGSNAGGLHGGLVDAFGGLNMGTSSPPPQTPAKDTKKSNQDILGLF